MTVVATLSAVLSLDDRQFRRGMRDSQNELGGMGDRLKRVGSQVSDFGANLSLAMAPVGAALGVAVNTTRQFDRNMSNVNAILGVTGDEAQSLRGEILAFGEGTVAGPMATSEAFYSIVSGVQDASTHMAILEAATRTAEAGQADLQGTTSGLISTMNAYGFAADDASYVSDVFTRTVQTGVLTMDELANALPQVTGLASQFGIGIDEVGGNLAYLTTQGYSAGESATFLKGMMTTLLAPTADMSEAIQALGYESGQALLEAEGIAGAYSLLSEQNGGLAGLVTNQEALQGAIALTNESAGEFMTTYGEGVAGATERAGAIQDETESWAQLQSRLEGLQIRAGSQLAPVLGDLLDEKIIPLTDGVIGLAQEHPELFKNIIMVMGGLVVLGPVLMLVGTLITGVTGFVSALISAAGLLTGGLVALASLGAWPLAAAIGAVLAASQALYPGGIIGMFNDAWTAAQQLGYIIGEAGLAGAFMVVERVISSAASSLQNFLGLQSQATMLDQVTSGNLGVGGSVVGGNIPGRAMGGPVQAGSAYMVGERGPELFVPNASGSIMNNRDTMQSMRGGGGIQIQNVTVNANSEAGGRAAARGFMDEMESLQTRLQGSGFSVQGAL